MTLAIARPANLETRLACLDVSRLARSERDVRSIAENNHYLLEGQTLTNGGLVARPRHGGDPIRARMPFLGRPVYVLEAGARRVEVHYRDSFGAGIASSAHHVFDLVEDGRKRGQLDHFPNRALLIGNRQKCLRLTFMELDGERFIQYQADIGCAWWRSRVYSVTVDADYAPVAEIAHAGGWLASRRHMRCHGRRDEVLVGALMAIHNGLVLRGTTG